MMRGFVLMAGLVGWATLAAAQTAGDSERTDEHAGESGAAKSQTIMPGPGEARQITGTATGSVSLTAEQRERLRRYFSQPGRDKKNESDAAFTVSVGAAIPRQITLQPLAHELEGILPDYKGDQYVVVGGRLVIATPDRRIVAIIPNVEG